MGVVFFFLAAGAQATRNLADLKAVDVGVADELTFGVERAAARLSRLSTAASPLEKILYLKQALNALTQPPARADGQPTKLAAISSDELIPLLMLAIVRSDEANWSATFAYLELFKLSNAYSNDIP